MYKHFCDSCLKQIRGTDHRCADCGSRDNEIYHKSCLKKINSSYYCPSHAKNHIENGLIIAYLKNTWRGLNLGGELSVRGLLDSDDWSDVTIKFPTLTFSFRGSWHSSSRVLLLKPNFASSTDVENLHKIKLHNHAGFRTALRTIMVQTVAKHMTDGEKTIKTHERDIKGIKKILKKEQFLSDVLVGKAKWPVPKPEPAPVLLEPVQGPITTT